jgi:hypothetical protein
MVAGVMVSAQHWHGVNARRVAFLVVGREHHAEQMWPPSRSGLLAAGWTSR